jgi:DNA-binding transcriptional ArsR family regulator
MLTLAYTMLTDMFGDYPRVRLLGFLVDHPGFDYTVTQMAEFAHLARPTVYKLIDELTKEGMLALSRSIGDSKLYRLNTENPKVVSILQADFARINRDLDSGEIDGRVSRRMNLAGSSPIPGLTTPGTTARIAGYGGAAQSKRKKRSSSRS